MIVTIFCKCKVRDDSIQLSHRHLRLSVSTTHSASATTVSANASHAKANGIPSLAICSLLDLASYPDFLAGPYDLVAMAHLSLEAALHSTLRRAPRVTRSDALSTFLTYSTWRLASHLAILTFGNSPTDKS